MTRPSSNISEVDRIWGDRIQQVKEKASTSLVTGSEYLAVLNNVASSRLVRGCLSQSVLVGLLRVSDEGVFSHDEDFLPYYERIEDKSICLVYLVEGESAKNLMEMSIPQGLSSNEAHYFGKYFQSHPFILFVEGKTDINFAKPFSTKEDAIEYLQTSSTFKTILSENLYVVEDVIDFMRAHKSVEPDALMEKALFYTH